MLRDFRGWALGGLVILIGLWVLAGWFLNISGLKSVLPGLSTMKVNTALGLTAGGVTAALLTMRNAVARRVALFSAVVMGLLGAATLVEYVSGVSLGIDQLIVADADPASAPFNGRMSPATAAVLLAAAVSFGLLASARSRLAVRMAHLLAAIPAAVGLLALTGYSYGVQRLYSFGPFVSIALHTAVCMLLLASAALLTRPGEGWEEPFVGRPIARAALRHVVWISVVIPFAAGLLVVIGTRRGLYQAAFSPALFAVATACALVWLAFRSARLIGSAEDDVRRAREEARLSDERLGLALNSGRGIGTWDWDVLRDRVVADQRFAQLYGVDPRLAAEGAPIAEFFKGIDAEDLPRVQEAVERALRTGEPFSQEYRLVRADGAERWVIAEGRCQLAADGTPTHFPGISFDITDRKSVETHQSTLLTLTDRLRDLTDPDAIAFEAARVLGEVLRVSRVGYGIVDTVAETISIERDWNAPGIKSLAGVLQFRDYGSYIEDLKLGETVVFADAERDPRTRDSAAALKAISACSVVNMPLVEQGGFVALLYANNASVRAWSDGDLVLMREVADRVRVASERLRADAARRQSEEQFRVFAQAVPNHIWVSRPDGYIEWYNEQVFAYTGEPQGALEGVSGWGQVLHPDDLRATAANWAHSLATGAVYETEFRIRRADGAYRWFLARAVPVKSATGEILLWVGTNTDVDVRRRQGLELAQLNSTLEAEVDKRTRALFSAEEQLRQSQKMEAVGQLTGGLAHDFNNLLVGITGSLELLSTRIAQGRISEIDRYVIAAQSSAKRASALTHRLLAFSRRQTLDPKPTDANRLVSGMEELIRRTVGPAVELEVVTAGGLWATLVDPNQLENALLNLCINARDAMPDGGRLTIETANKWLDENAARGRDVPAGQYIAVCVSDTGSGMTPDVVAKAFDPFFTTKPIGQGTGLGLSMTYGFVRQSGGQVRIYSEVDQGTMVCLYLPRHRGEPGEVEAATTLTATSRASAGETVLVVDDEPTVRMLVTEVLTELGYAAIEAADSAAGLMILQSNARIDLLITDVGLPGGMNGRQMADAARVHRPRLKVLFITGYAENAVVGNGHLDHDMHIVTKPFTIEAISNRIRGLLAPS